MPEYDGSIRINTEILTDNAKKDFKDLQNEINSVKKQNAGGETNKELDELIGKVKEYKKELDELYNNKQEESDEYQEIASKWKAAKEAVDDYMRSNMNLSEITETFKRQLDDLKASGYGFGDVEYDTVYKAWKTSAQAEKDYSMQLDKDTLYSQRLIEETNSKREAEEERLKKLKEEAIVSDQRTVDIVKELTELEAKRAELKKAGITQGYKEYDETTKRIKQIKDSLSESSKKFQETSKKAKIAIKSVKEEVSKSGNKFDEIGKKSKKAMKDVSDSTKNSTGLLGKFFKKIKSIAITTFIFMQIRKAFRQMVAALKEGFNNLVIYSDEYNKTMSALKSSQTQLKNSIAAAFGPVINMAIQGLTNLINYLIKATNAMGQFIAMLTGAKTWTKALAVQEDYAKSLDKTGASAKKAAKSLASFDTLEVLKKDSGGSQEINPKDMFTEELIEPQNFKLLDQIKEKLKEIFEIFKSGFKAGLGNNFADQLSNIKESAKSIWESLKDIFSDESVVEAAKNNLNKIVYAVGQEQGAIVSMYTTLSQLIVGSIANYLDENKQFLKEKLISIFDVTGEIVELIGNAMETFADIFSVFGSERAQSIMSNFIGIISNSLLNLSELTLKIFKDIATIILKPYLENKEKIKETIEGLLEPLNRFTSTVEQAVTKTGEKLSQVYDQHIHPFFENIGSGISQLTDTFLKIWQEEVEPILTSFSEKLDFLWNDNLEPLVNDTLDSIGDIADELSIFWNEVMIPFVDWFSANILPILLPAIEAIYNYFLEVITASGNEINGFIKILKGLIEYIVGMYTGDWEKAWKGIQDIVQGAADVIKGIINALLGFVESFVNSVIKAVNKVIDLINNIGGIELPEILGGGKIGINIPHIDTVAIPRLAQGDVIRGGNPFLAMLGDQPRGQTNIEAPLKTIEEAVRNVMNSDQPNNRQLIINMNYDGETFARLFMDDWIDEANRRGLDVDILGGNA